MSRKLPRMLTASLMAGSLFAGSYGISQAADPHTSLGAQIQAFTARLGRLETKVNHLKLTPGPRGPQDRSERSAPPDLLAQRVRLVQWAPPVPPVLLALPVLLDQLALLRQAHFPLDRRK